MVINGAGVGIAYGLAVVIVGMAYGLTVDVGIAYGFMVVGVIVKVAKLFPIATPVFGSTITITGDVIFIRHGHFKLIHAFMKRLERKFTKLLPIAGSGELKFAN